MLVKDGANKKLRLDVNRLKEQLDVTQSMNEIGLGALLKYSTISNDRFDDITRRLIAGFGLDWSNENAKVSFETFCRIHSFLTYFTTERSELTRLWVKILNPNQLPTMSCAEFEDLIERFARGLSISEPTLVSLKFAADVLQMLRDKGCCDDDQILMDRLKT